MTDDIFSCWFSGDSPNQEAAKLRAGCFNSHATLRLFDPSALRRLGMEGNPDFLYMGTVTTNGFVEPISSDAELFGPVGNIRCYFRIDLFRIMWALCVFSVNRVRLVRFWCIVMLGRLKRTLPTQLRLTSIRQIRALGGVGRPKPAS